MDATPGRFRPRQRPLVSSPGPWSRLVLSHFRSRLPLLPAFHSSRCFPTGRFRLTAPEPVPRPTTLLSLAVRRCRPAACSGLHATPGSFRPSQSPLVSSPGPWSFLQQLTLRRSRCSRFSAVSTASHRSLSPCGSAPVSRLTTLLSIAVRRCRPTACYGVHATPVSYRAESEPPGHQPRSQRFSPECWRLSSRTTLESRRQAFTSRFSGPTWALQRFSSGVARRVLRSARYPCFL